MTQHEYAPGMRVIIRDEEWMIKKIENIVRKSEVQSILDSSDPGFDDIRAFCSEEIIGDGIGRNKIGF